MRHATRRGLATACLCVLGACAAPVAGDIPAEPTIVSLGGDGEAIGSVDVGSLDVFSFHCAHAQCAVEIQVTGQLEGGDAPNGYVAEVVGPLEDILSVRSGLSPDFATNGRPDTVTSFLHDRRAVAHAEGSTHELEIGEGDHYGLLYLANNLGTGTLSVRVRVSPVADPATPLPRVDRNIYHVHRIGSSEGVITTERWYVAVSAMVGDSLTPTVRATVTTGGRASLYYVCGPDDERVPVELVRRETERPVFWKTYDGELSPSCSGTHDGGRLFVEMTTAASYDVDVVIAE